MSAAHPEQSVAPPLRVVDFDATQLGEHPDLIREISDQRTHVAIIRNVLARDVVDTLVSRVEAGECADRMTNVAEKFQIYSLGLALDTARSLEQYLAEAQKFVPECRTLFRGLPSYLDSMPATLHRMAGGREIELPSIDGVSYNPTTVRRLPPGALIPAHCEQEQLNRPAYEHLKGLIGGSSIISFFVTLRPPESGGEVGVYTLLWEDVAKSVEPGGRSYVEPLLDKYALMKFRPNAGDMILFEGGHHFHRVMPVGGAKTRWTIGGFVSESHGRDRVYYWS